jgi:hypothetical protein
MKTLKNSIVIFAISTLTILGCKAQNSIAGTIAEYENGAGLITFFDMITREPMVLGKIDIDGNFNIPLDENYLTVIKEKAKTAQENAPSGWQIKFKTVATTFECDFNNENIEYLDDGTEKITYAGSIKKNEIVYENGQVMVTVIPDPNLTDKDGKTVYSVLYAASQPEIAKWLYSYGQDNAVKGYYLQWFFVEDSATAKGECVVPTYTGIGEENYNHITFTNLELQKGWNIIKYNITVVFTDANGKITPSKIEITRITDLPADVQWHAINVE